MAGRYTRTIILIGPIGVGKSTVGKLLSEKLGLPQVSMDELRTGYYREAGYDEELARRKREISWWERYWYWKPFEADAVGRILAEHDGSVIDLGAGHSVYEDEMLFRQVQSVLSPYQNVVLLLPDPDIQTSLKILASREELADLTEINRHFLEHPSNRKLAKHIVYTREMQPEQVCEQVLQILDQT
jgi:shikimate kinase